MTKNEKSYGKLYLIPTTLGDSAPLEVLPISIKRTIEEVDHYIVENEKSARRFIKKISPRKSQPSLGIETLNKYTEPSSLFDLLKPCFEGQNMGIISEAGCPGVQVVPLVGPSSILLALMASGLNGQNFAFNGYLPIDSNERKKVIKEMEKKSKLQNQSQLFIETPYRNDKLLAEMLKSLSSQTQICIAVDGKLEKSTTKLTQTPHHFYHSRVK